MNDELLIMNEDWVEVELGDLCKFSQGVQVPKGKQFKENNQNRVRFLRIIDFTQGKDEPRYIEKPNEINIVAKNDISMVRYGTVGFVCTGIEGAIANNLFRIIPRLKIDKKYLINFLISGKFKNQINAKGATMQALSFALINPIKVPLPPLPTQRAIVSKIESLFSDLDNGIANLKKAQEQLKIYRQAVLSSSFSKSEKIEMSKLVDKLSQGWSPKCINQSSIDNSQWAVIKTSAIQSGKFIEFENKILPDTLKPREQHEIKKGDILITRAGPRVRVGICCLVRKTRPKLINCDKVYRLELNKKMVSPEFFEYALNSPEILRKIEKMKSGSSDSGLNLTQKVFLQLQIPFTSKERQHQIVQEIETRLSVCDKVEQSITESLEKAKALRQSILKKAFEGKLLSEAEIESCKQEKDYEPASVLLENIKAEKNRKDNSRIVSKKRSRK